MPNADELVKLSDSGLTVERAAEDVRNRDVLDRQGDKIGTVDDLYIDPQERKVRFLAVASGGFLGIGEKHVLIPVDDITRIDRSHVFINRSREFIASGPTYDPELVTDADYWTNLYSYYGYSPYWAPVVIASQVISGKAARCLAAAPTWDGRPVSLHRPREVSDPRG